MAKKQKNNEVEEQVQVVTKARMRHRLKKMKYHPVARHKGCINCD